MKILIVTGVYPPEPVVSARTSADVAQAAFGKGATVSVFAPVPNRPEGVIPLAFRGRWLWQRREENGINVTRIRSFISRSGSSISRTTENISFGALVAVGLIFCSKPSVIYLNTWPVIATGLAALVARIRGIPYIISVQDVYPESLSVQGRLCSRTLIYKFLRRIDDWISKNAFERILLSEGMRQIYVQRGATWAESAQIVPNWLDKDFTDSCNSADLNEYRAKLGVPIDAKLFVYGGNIGVASGLRSVVATWQAHKQGAELYLLIAGSGTELEYCREVAVRSGSQQIKFLSPWSRDETHLVLGVADVFLLSTFGDQSLVSVPSKLLTYMATGRPILALAQATSETARVIYDARCGLVVEPANTSHLYSAIAQIRGWSKEESRKRGQSGREFFLENFNRDRSIDRILDALERAVQ